MLYLLYLVLPYLHDFVMRIIISNGNRTEWSPVRSVIIGVINKIGRTRSAGV